MKNERAEEGNNGGGEAIVECRKKGRTEDGKACKEEGESVELKSVYRHVQQYGVIGYEDLSNGGGKKLRDNKHCHRRNSHDNGAFLQQSLQLRLVLCAEMIADDRGDAYRIADKNFLLNFLFWSVTLLYGWYSKETVPEK